MKFSFTVQSKPPKPPLTTTSSTFSSTTTTTSPSPQTLTPIIRPIPNTFQQSRPESRMKNIDLPPLHSSNPNLDHQFEIDSLPDSQTDNNNSTGDTYGLILREKKEREEDKRRRDENQEHGPGTDMKESKRRSREEGRRDGVVENGNGVRGSRTEEKGSQVPWLRSHIRVRIISKELKSGRLYLKKGEVVDVVGPTSCDISMDESKELVQGVDQSILETALPKRGGPVLVLLGKHKGVYGSLVERDMERESGVVQDADTHDLLNVKLEQIAEYVGDPSYLGY